jgi:hypothetical protein
MEFAYPRRDEGTDHRELESLAERHAGLSVPRSSQADDGPFIFLCMSL